MCPPNVRERQYLGSRPRVVWGEPPPVLCGLDGTNTRTPSSSATVSAATERLTCRTFRHGCRERMARTLNGSQVSTIGNGAGCHPKIHLAYHEARIALVLLHDLSRLLPPVPIPVDLVLILSSGTPASVPISSSKCPYIGSWHEPVHRTVSFHL